MTRLIEPLLVAARPLNSPFLALLVTGLLALPGLRRRSPGTRLAALGAAVALFAAVHGMVCRVPRAAEWLLATESPLIAVLLVVVLPAVYLPPGRARRLFLLVPAGVLVAAAVSAVENWLAVPAGKWAWFLIRPAWLLGGVASLLVLVQPLLRLRHFRTAVRLACLLVLVWGGTIFRTGYADYRAAVGRRPKPPQSRSGAALEAQKPDIMKIEETVPVLQHRGRKTYLPSAPCRFTADGGYVQGCNMELAQRVMQADWAGIVAGDAGPRDEMGILLGACVLFLVMSFVLARWFCGWLCPLSTIGGALDWARRRLRLPHLKPARPVKLAYLFSGAGLAGLTLAMARAYPHIDAETGRFMGCKLPLHPFCKICPSQQVCPVVSAGPAAYPGLPGWAEWPFFRTMVLVLLVLFAASFALGRRLWCRFCPMGMISGIFNRGGLMRLRKNATKCNRCGVCAEVCPMDIDLVRSEMRREDVSSYDCVLCLECVAKCPRDGCLALEHNGFTVAESRYTGDS